MNYLWLIALTVVLMSEANGQYYRPPPPSYPDFGSSDSSDFLMRSQHQQYHHQALQQQQSDLIEKKYVNSGQSVLMVCDLPNNMPDGKVSF